MRSDDERTTQEFENQRNPASRGRRRSDQIFEGITWGRVTKVATALTLVGGIVVATISAAASILVTRPQLKEVTDTLSNFKTRTERDVQSIRARQDSVEEAHHLLEPMARLTCLQLQRERSGTLADAAGLPCDQLLRRVR